MRLGMIPTLLAVVALAMFCGAPALAADGQATQQLAMTHHWAGYAVLAIFVMAYALVMNEEKLHMPKSVPMLVAAGLIWAIIAIAYSRAGLPDLAAAAVRHNLLEFGEIFLFLLAAMTFINTMQERGIFDALRGWWAGAGPCAASSG